VFAQGVFIVMQRSIVRLFAVFAAFSLGLAGISAATQGQKGEQEKSSLSGTWIAQAGETRLEFGKKDVLKILPHADEEVIAIVCQYTVDKKGLIKAKVTGYGGKEEFRQKVREMLPEGFAFTFQWTVKADVATISDLKGIEDEHLKSHLEGKYEQKK
jgi:hypothetical protein